ncbi:DUF1643 domain-containing protein [Tropicimonas sp. IMCC34011]|uniref:DUF1643 domain-containing protein n=1 Tax=Tropicimonas sp. IMCC34011 TaxID=2248759 RepID=UPI000E26C8C8|nr:DUF1643 domain-containing protein [Tropicimonas sp. IMCC34011]
MSGVVLRRFVSDGVESEASYSPCELYRYHLERRWAEGRRLCAVLLNPSTATETKNDPTIERCVRRARSLGYGAIRICNLFALRATRPQDLKAHGDPVGGAAADSALRAGAAWADDVLCGWGAHGAHLGRGEEVAQLLATCGRPLLALGETKAGAPRHPLYVAYSVHPAPWRR